MIELLKKSKDKISLEDMNRKRLIKYFVEPNNWEYVLKSFPKLKICLAHYGSETEILKRINNPDNTENFTYKIERLIKLYHQNIYTDIFFLPKRLMFGRK